MPDTPGWLDNLRPQLERKNVASIAALEDYLSVIGDATPALWADLQGKLIVVYAITDDWLHVFRGPADDLPPPSSPDERYASTCDYTAVRITADATFNLSVKSTARRSYTPSTDPPVVTDVERKWTFHVGNERLSLTSPPSQQQDPEEFARRLASVILDTRGGETAKVEPSRSRRSR